MIEEGIAFSTSIFYSKEDNLERKRRARRNIGFVLREFGAENIQLFPPESEFLANNGNEQSFEVRGYSPGKTSMQTIEQVLKRAGAKEINKQNCSIQRRER